jgi:hypothetical protein
MRKRLYLSLLLCISGCASNPVQPDIIIQDSTVCSASGIVSAGANCAHTLSSETSQLTLDQFMNFLEAQQNPSKAPAICMSANDWSQLDTAIKSMCRELGGKCAFATPKK